VQKETTQELLRRQSHARFLISMSVILPEEDDLVIVKGQEAVIADGDANPPSRNCQKGRNRWTSTEYIPAIEQAVTSPFAATGQLRRCPTSEDFQLGSLTHVFSTIPKVPSLGYYNSPAIDTDATVVLRMGCTSSRGVG
jgi:hypothetical protein